MWDCVERLTYFWAAQLLRCTPAAVLQLKLSTMQLILFCTVLPQPLLLSTATTAEGHAYSARFPTRTSRYSTVRLPWVLFRPEAEGLPPFDPAAIKHISLRYELRKPVPASTAAAAAAAAAAAPAMPAVPAGARLPSAAAGGAVPSQALQLQRQRMLAQQAAANTKFERFKIEVDWIKALPSGKRALSVVSAGVRCLMAVVCCVAASCVQQAKHLHGGCNLRGVCFKVPTLRLLNLYVVACSTICLPLNTSNLPAAMFLLLQVWSQNSSWCPAVEQHAPALMQQT
jgi:hypothetical protein